MTARFFNPSPQFFTAAGKVVAGGFVNFWATGTTNNQDTFPTSALSGANANPVPLDSAGRTTVPVFADPSKSFSVRVIDADSVVVIATEDDISFVRSNVISAADAVAALTANAVAGVYNGTEMTGTAFANFASNLDLTAAGSIDASAGAITLGTVTGATTFSGNITTTSTTITTGLRTPRTGILTISSGVVTYAGNSFTLIATEASASTDDLDTINGGVSGDRLVLTPASDSDTVVVKDGTGNLQIAGDFSLDSSHDTIELIFSTNVWLELSRTSGGS